MKKSHSNSYTTAKVVRFSPLRRLLYSMSSSSGTRGVIAAVFYAAVCCEFLFIFFAPTNSTTRHAMLAIAVIGGIAIVFLGYFEYLDTVDLRAYKALHKRTEQMYFCGLPLAEYIDTLAFPRLGEWLGRGLCYEVAPLCMLALHDFPRSRFCKGTDVINGRAYGHAWVEFKPEGLGWFVIDPAWISPSILPRRQYYQIFPHRKIERQCDKREFWRHTLSHRLYESMFKKGTSYIYNYLCLYHDDSEGGFDPRVEDCQITQYIENKEMLPADANKRTGKILTSSIFRDFAKKSTRMQPRARTLRRSWAFYKRRIRENEPTTPKAST